MTRHKCHSCGRPAFAYRIEPDGTRTYLCEKHIPTDETSGPDKSSGPVFHARENGGPEPSSA